MAPAQRPWTRSRRNLWAVVVLVVFALVYVTLIGLALGLAALPIVMMETLHMVSGLVVVFCLTGALVLLAALVPRTTPAVSIGIAVPETEEPELWGTIREVASEMSARPPDDLFLGPGSGAFVVRAGARMGVGGRNQLSLGLGLTLLADRNLLRAVVAHELAHLDAGDTRLSALVGGLVRGLGESEAMLRAGAWPVMAFPLRILGGIVSNVAAPLSREQERLADGRASALGGDHLPLALALVSCIDEARLDFHKEVLVPLGRDGQCLLHFHDTLRRFVLAVPEEQVSTWFRRALAQPTTFLDSHPSLAERMRQLQDLRPLRAGSVPVHLANRERFDATLSEPFRRWSDRPVPWAQVVVSRVPELVQLALRVQATGEGDVVRRMKEALRSPAMLEAESERVSPWLASYRWPDRTEVLRREAARWMAAWLGTTLSDDGSAWTLEPGGTWRFTTEGRVLDLVDGFHSTLRKGTPVEWMAELLARAEGRRVDGMRWKAPRAFLEPDGGGRTTYTFALREARWPGVCGKCLQSPTVWSEVRLALGAVTFRVPSCAAHIADLPNLFRGIEWYESAQRVRLEFREEKYGRLFELANSTW